jgi:hypothetical protein
VQSAYRPRESAFGRYDSGTTRPQLFDDCDVGVTVGWAVKNGFDAPDYCAIAPRVIDIEVRDHKDVDVGDAERRKAFSNWGFGAPHVDQRDAAGISDQDSISLPDIALRPRPVRWCTCPGNAARADG